MILLSIGQDAQDLVLDGPLLIAGLIALAAGALSFFSPCCLPLVSGYLGYVAGLAGEEADDSADPTTGAPRAAERDTSSEGSPAVVTRSRTRGRTVWGAVLFVAGFAVVFTGYGWLFGSFGAWLITYQETLIRVLGVVTVLVGLIFTGLLWRIPLAGRSASRIGHAPAWPGHPWWA